MNLKAARAATKAAAVRNEARKAFLAAALEEARWQAAAGGYAAHVAYVKAKAAFEAA